MKALVVSGGGSKGAFAGGIAEYLIDQCCHQYDLLVGCSTGSLLLTHLAIGEIEKIKKVYTSVSQSDIFSINPFKIKKTKTGYKTSINHLNTIRTFIKGCPTFGESENLRQLIKNTISKEDFISLKKSNKKVIFTVSNLTLDTIEYFNSDECDYEDYCDWAWASCNFTPFMSILNKNNYQYADGGFGSYVPILNAIENGACDIDVIILENEENHIKHPKIKNPFSLLFRTFKFMSHHNSSKDIIIGKLTGLKRKVNINFYYTPYQLTDNPLIFDKNQMTSWWQEGFEYAKIQKPISFCHSPNLETSL